MQKFGRYEIMTELGRGGMATVYLAHDPAFERQVAIKVLPGKFTHDPQFRARFMREAKVIAALEHPFIVPVYDYGEEGENPFIVMRYMTGGTLADRIAHGPMPLAEVAPVVQRLADALDDAHSHDVVHRDLKPSNVLFDARGDVFLSDFGLAKMSDTTTRLTFTGVMVGTPDYMSPEQAIGDEETDRRSDVYSLGVILFEMLSGELPYATGTAMKTMFKHVNAPVPELNADRFALPGEINAILTRALAKKPEDRYQTAGEFATDVIALAPAVASSSGARPPSVPGVKAPSGASPSTKPVSAVRTQSGVRPPSGVSPSKSTKPLSSMRRIPDAAVQPTRPIRTTSSSWRWVWGGGIGLAMIASLVGGAMLAIWNGWLFPNPTATATLTVTVAPSATITPTATLPPNTNTPAPSPTFTPVNTATPIPSATLTDTPTAPADTPTFTPTPTKRPAARTPTPTPIPPTVAEVSTQLPPTDTPAPTHNDSGPTSLPPAEKTLAPPSTEIP